MMKALSIVSALFIGGLASITTLSAQEGYREPLPQRGALVDGKTIVKTNPITLLLGSYNLSVERLLSKHFSVELGLGIAPLSRSAYEAYQWQDFSLLSVDDSAEKSKGYSIALGAKLYVSKTGYGHGFYFQTILAHSSNTGCSSQVMNLKSENVANIRGVETRHNSTLGVGIGVQWLIGKRRNIVLDWNILNLNRELSFKDKRVYTLYGNKPFSRADSNEVLHKVLGSELGFWGGLFNPALGYVEVNEPFKDGEEITFTREKSKKWGLSMDISIGFRF